MTRPVRFLPLVLGCLLAAAPAYAQAPSGSQQTASEDDTLRAATTTADGDTGLWYTPTAEVLAKGKWSASGYRVSQNYTQGFSNVAYFPLTFAVGIANRAEVFASWRAVTRIDRDIRPIFTTDDEVGGVAGPYPYTSQGWSGNKRGDLLIGAKVNLLSEADNRPVALAVRGSLKLPTGEQESGASTGKTDGFLDFIVSKHIGNMIELSGYAGGAFRSSTDDFTQSNGLRWGIGGGFPTGSPLRVTAELNGERPSDDVTVLSTSLAGTDGSLAPVGSVLRSYTTATLGLTYQHRSGFFVGAASSWAVPRENRELFNTDDNDAFGDFVDFQFRIGFHPGVRRYVPPPPPRAAEPPPVAPPPQAPANRPPVVSASASPNAIESGQTTRATATASDPDGDQLTYRWTAPVGTFTNPNAAATEYRPPADFEGTVELTVTVTDGRGGSASASTTITVRRPAPVVELSFEDVYFDFDRSTLRPEAQRLLDDAVTKLMANPTKNLVIEGHTCNIGTAEYNLALGERRAKAVTDYLTAHGVPGTRLETRSFGEESPKFDNSREETRRLNRRAALVVKVQ